MSSGRTSGGKVHGRSGARTFRSYSYPDRKPLIGQVAQPSEPIRRAFPGRPSPLNNLPPTQRQPTARPSGNSITEPDIKSDARHRTGLPRGTDEKPLPDPRGEASCGFPAPGPVGQVVLNNYPAYRAVVVQSVAMQGVGPNGMFQPLLQHIKRKEIVMTAPAEMRYHCASPPAPRQTVPPSSAAHECRMLAGSPEPARAALPRRTGLGVGRVAWRAA
jgi:hypothetical protein